MALIDDLRTRRAETRAAADELLNRAAAEERDLTSEEATEHRGHTSDLRDIEDRLEDMRDQQLREARAEAARPPAEPEAHALGRGLTRAIHGDPAEAGEAGETRAVETGAWSPTAFPSLFFDRLAANSVGLASGFDVITTDRHEMTVPHVTADTGVSWVSEGDTISSSDHQAEPITAVPRKLAGLQPVSNEALADSNPSLMERIAGGLARALALRADAGFFEGSGTAPEITGLSNTSGIQTHNAGGAVPTNLDAWATAIGLLESADATATAIVMHPSTWADLLLLKETSGSNEPLLTPNQAAPTASVRRAIYGIPVFLTSQVTAGTSFVYEAGQVVVVRRTEVQIETDTSVYFDSDMTAIRGIVRVDLAVPNPAAIVRITGLTAAGVTSTSKK